MVNKSLDGSPHQLFPLFIDEIVLYLIMTLSNKSLVNLTLTPLVIGLPCPITRSNYDTIYSPKIKYDSNCDKRYTSTTTIICCNMEKV